MTKLSMTAGLVAALLAVATMPTAASPVDDFLVSIFDRDGPAVTTIWPDTGPTPDQPADEPECFVVEDVFIFCNTDVDPDPR